jgi:hypothetical protein
MTAIPCFTYSGTELEREGQSPLLAVALYAPDGRLAEATVVDPSAGPIRSGSDTQTLVDGVAWIDHDGVARTETNGGAAG